MSILRRPNEDIAISLIIGCFLTILLVSFNHGGTVYYGLLYVPYHEPLVAVVPYTYIILSILMYFNYRLRSSGLLLTLPSLLYITGFYFLTASSMSLISGKYEQTALYDLVSSILYDLFFVLLGLTLESIIKGEGLGFISFVIRNSNVDYLSTSVAFILLACTRLANKSIPMILSIFFAFASWIPMAMLIRNYIKLNSNGGLKLSDMILLASVNVTYLAFLKLISL